MKLLRLLRYSAAGTVGTAIQYTTLLCLVRTGVTGPIVASSSGAIAGAFTNYFLNYHFTFNSQNRHVNAAPKFFLVALAGFIINWAAMTMLLRHVGMHYLAAQILSTGLVFMVTYAINAGWSFREDRAQAHRRRQ